jgi:hypothetical protein
MKQLLLGMAAWVSLAGWLGQADAGMINLATGLDASNNLITTGGAPDAHWTVDRVTGGTSFAQVVTPYDVDWGPGWSSDGPNSAWISRDASVYHSGPAPYTFHRTFDLTGYDLSKVSISGGWTIDDGGTLTLNGHQLDAVPVLRPNAYQLKPFSVPAGSPFLNQGLNTLDITMKWAGGIEAVRLEGSVSDTAAAASPEPSTLLLAGLGVLGLTGHAWRRRKRAAR